MHSMRTPFPEEKTFMTPQMPTHWGRYCKELHIARTLGWNVDDSLGTMRHNGPKFIINNTHIWKIRGGWQCADYVKCDDGNTYASNHRPARNLIKLLIDNAFLGEVTVREDKRWGLITFAEDK